MRPFLGHVRIAEVRSEIRKFDKKSDFWSDGAWSESLSFDQKSEILMRNQIDVHQILKKMMRHQKPSSEIKNFD
jgi:hypothetical protein